MDSLKMKLHGKNLDGLVNEALQLDGQGLTPTQRPRHLRFPPSSQWVGFPAGSARVSPFRTGLPWVALERRDILILMKTRLAWASAVDRPFRGRYLRRCHRHLLCPPPADPHAAPAALQQFKAVASRLGTPKAVWGRPSGPPVPQPAAVEVSDPTAISIRAKFCFCFFLS